MALDLICQQLYEVGAEITPDILQGIADAANEMGLPASEWEFVAELVK